jgi:molybdopterin-guanine dinucleotide biosynthesis protein A
MVLLIAAWVLCGGEGRRMGGQDKGLLTWRERPLAWHVATALAPQVTHLDLNANRHLDQYRQWSWPVIPDDPDLPLLSGPLIGILTGLRHGQTPWLQLAPCDGPTLPLDLVVRLHQATQASDIEIAVPQTIDAHTGETRHHWTTALIARHLRPSLEDAVLGGERRVHRWMTQQRWIGVCFEAAADFANINTPETLHGHS